MEKNITKIDGPQLVIGETADKSYWKFVLTLTMPANDEDGNPRIDNEIAVGINAILFNKGIDFQHKINGLLTK